MTHISNPTFYIYQPGRNGVTQLLTEPARMHPVDEEQQAYQAIDRDIRENKRFKGPVEQLGFDPETVIYSVEKKGEEYWIRVKKSEDDLGQGFIAGGSLKNLASRYFVPSDPPTRKPTAQPSPISTPRPAPSESGSGTDSDVEMRFPDSDATPPVNRDPVSNLPPVEMQLPDLDREQLRKRGPEPIGRSEDELSEIEMPLPRRRGAMRGRAQFRPLNRSDRNEDLSDYSRAPIIRPRIQRVFVQPQSQSDAEDSSDPRLSHQFRPLNRSDRDEERSDFSHGSIRRPRIRRVDVQPLAQSDAEDSSSAGSEPHPLRRRQRSHHRKPFGDRLSQPPSKERLGRNKHSPHPIDSTESVPPRASFKKAKPNPRKDAPGKQSVPRGAGDSDTDSMSERLRNRDAAHRSYYSLLANRNADPRQLRELQQLLKSQEAEIRRLQTQLDGTNTRLDELLHRLASMGQESRSARLDPSMVSVPRAQHEQLLADIARLQGKIEQLEGQQSVLHKSYLDAQQAIRELQGNVESLATERDGLACDLGSKNQELRDLAQFLETAQADKARLEQQLARLEKIKGEYLALLDTHHALQRGHLKALQTNDQLSQGFAALAEEFEAYKTESREREAVLRQRLSQNHAERQQLKDQNRALTEELAALNGKNRQLFAENERLKQERGGMEGKVDRLQSEIRRLGNLDERHALLKEQYRAALGRIEELESRESQNGAVIQKLQKAIASKEATNQKLREQFERSSGENRDLRSQLDAAKLENGSLREQSQHARSEFDRLAHQLQATIDLKQREIEGRDERIEQLTAANNSLQAELTQLQQRHTQALAALQTKEEELTASREEHLRANRAAGQTIHELQESLGAAKQELAQTKTALQKHAEKLQEATEQLAALRISLASLEAENPLLQERLAKALRELEQFYGMLQTEQRAHRALREQHTQLQASEEQFRLLAEQLQASLASAGQENRALLDQLSHVKGAVQSIEAERDRLLSGLEEQENTIQQLRLEQRQWTTARAALEQTLAAMQTELSQAKNSFATQFQEQADQLSAANEQIATLTQTLSTLKSDKEQEIQSLKDALSQARSYLTKQKQSLDALGREQGALRDEHTRLKTTTQKELATLSAAFKIAAEQLGAENSSLRTQLNEALETIQSMQADQKELYALRQEIDTLQSERGQLKDLLKQASDQAQSNGSRVLELTETLEREHSLHKERLARLEQDLSARDQDYQKQLAELRTAHRKEMDRIHLELQAAKREQAEAHETNLRLTEALQQLEQEAAELRPLKQEIERLRRENREQSSQLLEIQAQLDFARQELDRSLKSSQDWEQKSLRQAEELSKVLEKLRLAEETIELVRAASQLRIEELSAQVASNAEDVSALAALREEQELSRARNDELTRDLIFLQSQYDAKSHELAASLENSSQQENTLEACALELKQLEQSLQEALAANEVQLKGAKELRAKNAQLSMSVDPLKEERDEALSLLYQAQRDLSTAEKNVSELRAIIEKRNDAKQKEIDALSEELERERTLMDSLRETRDRAIDELNAFKRGTAEEYLDLNETHRLELLARENHIHKLQQQLDHVEAHSLNTTKERLGALLRKSEAWLQHHSLEELLIETGAIVENTLKVNVEKSHIYRDLEKAFLARQKKIEELQEAYQASQQELADSQETLSAFKDQCTETIRDFQRRLAEKTEQLEELEQRLERADAATLAAQSALPKPTVRREHSL